MTGRSSSVARGGLALALLLATLVAFGAGAHAERLETVAGFAPRDGGAAVWNGTHVFYFGGHSDWGDTREIVRFDPATGQVDVLPERLPRDMVGAAAAWDGTHAWIFGGQGRTIVKYNPATGAVSTPLVLFPWNVYYPSAAFDGRYVWIAESIECTDSTEAGNTLWRFDPQTEELEVWSTWSPGNPYFWGSSMVWAGDHLVIVGGRGCRPPPPFWYHPYPSNTLIEYWTDTHDSVEHEIPSDMPGYGGRWHAASVWDGRHVWVLGGSKWVSYGAVFRFDPATDRFEGRDVRTAAHLDASAVFDGRQAWILGGRTNAGHVGTIQRLSFAPSAPTNVAVAPGPGVGELTVTWDPPAHAGSGPVTGYRVFRTEVATGARVDLGVVAAPPLVDAGLWSGAVYRYEVAAVNAEAGEGDLAAPVAARTPPGPPSPPLSPAAWPGPARGQIEVSWQAPRYDGDLPITAYRVLRDGVQVAELAADARRFADGTFPDGEPHAYEVLAVNSAGAGAATASFASRAPTEPQPPAAFVAVPRYRELILGWGDSTDDGGMPVLKYRLYAGPSPDALALVAERGYADRWSSPSWWTGQRFDHWMSSLADNQTVHWSVATVTGWGEGPRSPVQSGTTFHVATPPRNLRVADTWEKFGLAWDPPADAGSPWTITYSVEERQADGTWTLRASGVGGTSWASSWTRANVTATFRVVAHNGVGASTPTAPVTGTTARGAPHPPGVTGVPGPGAGEVTLTIRPSNDGGYPVTTWNVFRATGNWACGWSTGNVVTHAYDTTVVLSGLGDGATHRFCVSASNAGGSSVAGPQISVTTWTPPSAPRNLATAPGGAGEVVLTWDAPSASGSRPVTGYRVWRGASAGAEVAVADVGDVRTWTDAGLANDAAYSYRLQALADPLAGALTGSVAARTPVAGTPGLPGDVRAAPGPGFGEVTLTWDPPADTGVAAVSGYRIYRGTTAWQETFLVETGPVPAFTDVGLGDGTSWSYRVAAVNADGQGGLSDPVAAATAPAGTALVTGLGAVGDAERRGSALVEWDAVDGASGYRVWRTVPDGREDLAAAVGPGASRVRTFAPGAEGMTVIGTDRYQDVEWRAPGYIHLGSYRRDYGSDKRGEWDLPAQLRPGRDFTVEARWWWGNDRWDIPNAGKGMWPLYLAPQGGAGPRDAGPVSIRYDNDGANDVFTLRHVDALGNVRFERAFAVPAPHAGAAYVVKIGYVAAEDRLFAEVRKADGALVGQAGATGSAFAFEKMGVSTDGRSPGYYTWELYAGLDDLAVILGAGRPGYLATGLPDDAAVRFRVSAITPAGEGPRGEAVTALTRSGVPLAPAALAATGGPGEGEVTLAWAPPLDRGASPVEAYVVYREGTAVASVDAETFVAHDLDASPDPFERKAPQPRSEVAWDAAAGRIAVLSDRRDTADERMEAPLPAPLTPETSFDVRARWAATQQGNWQKATPLFLAGGAVTQPNGQGNSAFVAYASRDANRGQAPAMGLGYRDPSGAVRFYQEFPVAVGAVYDVAIAYDAPTSTLRLTVTDAAGQVKGAAAYALGTNAGDAFAFDKVGVASDAMPGIDTTEPAMRGWTDDVTIHVENLAWRDADRGDGTTWTYAVAAVNAQGEGPASALASATTLVWPPSAPVNLTAAGGPGVGEVTLAWEPPARSGTFPMSGYVVARHEGAGAPVVVAELGPEAASFTDAGLPDGAAYTWTVAARNDVGTGAAAEVAARTFDRPGAPRDLRATPGLDGAVDLAWSPPATDGGTPVVGWRVWRQGFLAWEEELVAELPAANLTWSDAGRDAGSAWQYRVTAVNLVGEGLASEPAYAPGTRAEAPPPPGPPDDAPEAPEPPPPEDLEAWARGHADDAAPPDAP